jgi:hypothetical protein
LYTFDKVIPEKMLGFLPFSEEPVSEWNQKTDLMRFIYALYDYEGRMVDPSGKEIRFSWTSVSKEFFDESVKTSNELAESFGSFAKPYKDAPDFLKDGYFGQAAKNKAAWERVIQASLEESVFFSLTHVLESETDLQASFLLASQMYYKQALAVLRGFLEDLVLPIKFCADPQAFFAWRSNNYRIPPLRGNRGLLRELETQGVFSRPMSQAISDLYDELNGSIHGLEIRLNYRGLYAGRYRTESFNYQSFREWCEYVNRTMGVAIPLFRTNVIQWEKVLNSKPEGTRVCVVCHNEKDFEVTEVHEGTTKFYLYRCKRCGGESHYPS